MSYTALYRKFRPDQFEEVKGQDHIVTTLRNQIMADRIGHAYLFTGTRGTGKTTIAKLFAKSVIHNIKFVAIANRLGKHSLGNSAFKKVVSSTILMFCIVISFSLLRY